MKKIIITLILICCLGALSANGVLIKNGITGQLLELKECDLEVQITNQVAVSTATMRFKNQYSSATTTVFAFPLESESSATALSWYINGSWHEAVIAPGAGGSVVPPDQTMYLPLEAYLGKIHTVFPVSEALLPNEEMIFRVTWVRLLPYLNGRIDYSFLSGYGYLSNPDLDSLNVDVQISGPRQITNLSLPSYPDTQINYNGTSASFEMSLSPYHMEGTIDFFYNLAMENLGANTLSTLIDHTFVPDDHGDGFFLSVVEPQPSGTVIPKYFTFMLDRSNVMSGPSILQARQAAIYMIQNLNAGDFFNIVDFSTVAGTFAVNHVPYTPQNRDLAITYINNLEPTGSCNIAGAFDTAIPQFALAPANVANIIVFLSRGLANVGITNSNLLLDHIEDLVAATQRSINIFCFGVGQDVNFSLLSQIAATNQGISTYVGMGELLSVLVDFYTKIRNPILLGPVLDIDDTQNNFSETYPEPLPNLYLGNQMILCGRYHNATNLSFNISGDALGAPVNYSFESQLSSTALADNQFLMKVWAKLKIEHLLAIYYQLNPYSTEAISLKEQIIDISIDYGVLCPLTNFSGGEVANSDEEMPPVLNPLQITFVGPNPFKTFSTVRVRVNDAKLGEVVMKIYNTRGQLVHVIQRQTRGTDELSFYWDGCDKNGKKLPSGIYLCQVSAGGFCRNVKLMLMH